jgi:hypothetical protein
LAELSKGATDIECQAAQVLGRSFEGKVYSEGLGVASHLISARITAARLENKKMR